MVDKGSMKENFKTYTELSQFHTFRDRFNYLKLEGQIGIETFGFDRYLNQALYRSPEWKRVRDLVIIRDNGCDLGIDDYEIHGRIIIHHMNPLTEKDIVDRSDLVLNPEFLISTTINTHNAIHYSDDSILIAETPIVRSQNDCCPWRK